MTATNPAGVADGDAKSLIAHGAITSLQVIVLLLCWMINLLDGFDILAISFTAVDIAKEWSLAPDELGIVFSGGLIGMMVGALTIAPLGDQIGRKTVLVASLVIIAAAMISTNWAASVTMLFMLRVLTGLGVGGIYRPSIP